MGDTASRNLVAEPPRSHYGSLPTSNRETASKVNGWCRGVTSGTGIPLHIDLFFFLLFCHVPCFCSHAHIFHCVKTIRMLGTAHSAPPLQGDVDREAQTGGRRELSGAR